MRVSPAMRAVLILQAHNTASLDQQDFRGRNDDGSQSAATWKALVNTNWTQVVDENFRVRFAVRDDGGGALNDVQLQLEYNLNGAGWNPVNAASLVVRSAASGNFAEGDSTTQQISTTGGTFITPNSGMDESNGLAGEANDIDFVDGVNDEVEVEFCAQVRSADVANNDVVQLRVTAAGTPLGNYTNTPSVTVSEAAAGALLEGSASGSATLAAALTTAIEMVGAAVASVVMVAALTTAIEMAGSAQGAATAAGELTAPQQGALLEGAAAGSVSTVGALTTEITLAASAVASGDAAGILSTEITLAGAATGTAAAVAALTTEITLQGAALGSATAVGELEGGGALLAGAPLGTASAIGSLETEIVLVGAASSSASTSASLTTDILLVGAALGSATAGGDLLAGGGALLEGTALGSASLAGEFAIEVLRALVRIERTWPLKLVMKRTWNLDG